MDMEIDSREVIDAFRDFEKRSSAKFGKQVDRIRADRTFLSGSQWDRDDDRAIAAERNRQTVNVVENSVNAVTNNYTSYPYAWYTGNPESDQACDSFLKTGCNSRAAVDALHSAVSFGLGVMVLSTEMRDGVAVPTAYSVPDVTGVMLDPDSTEIDGSDAKEAAIVEMRSKNWVRSVYGDGWVPGKGVLPLVDVSSRHSDDEIPVVTYYRMEDLPDGTRVCRLYRLLGNGVADGECAELPISRVPVFPVFGERTWLDDDTQVFQGLVRKSRSVQKLVNYCFTQLGERLAIAPKPVFMGSVEALEGLDEGYRNFTRTMNPVLLYNRKDGKETLEKPERIDNRVPFDDLSGIIGTSLSLFQSVTGLDPKGIVDQKQELTATEVMYNAKAYQTNVRHYYDNLRDSFKSVGDTFLEMLGIRGRNVDVVQGPEEFMQRQVARQELAQIAQLVPDSMKMKVVNAILMTHSDNAVLMDLFGRLNEQPQPTEREMALQQQVLQLQEQAKKLSEENEYFRKSASETEKGIQGQVLMERVKHANELDKMAFQAQLDGEQDAERSRTELAKDAMDLEKRALQLDAAKAKAAADGARANVEMMKSEIDAATAAGGIIA